jgi:hypothetical protein
MLDQDLRDFLTRFHRVESKVRKVSQNEFTMPDVVHTFRRGHRACWRQPRPASTYSMAGKPRISGSPAGVIKLPEPRQDGRISVESALRRRRPVREFRKESLTLAEISQLLWSAQGITDPEGKQSAPLAGVLYPLEVFLVAGWLGRVARRRIQLPASGSRVDPSGSRGQAS